MSCRFASATTLSRLSSGDAAEYGRIRFEHAIVLSEVGRNDEALHAMRAAMARASLDQGALSSDAASPVTVAGRVILERAQRLDVNSAAFKTFAKAIEDG